MKQTPFNDQERGISTRINELWQRLITPHPSIKDVGEIRRTQLLSILTLILSILFISAFIYGPSSIGVFVALTAITAASYLLSRTRYYKLGTYLFTYVFTAIGYIRIYQGTASSIESSVVSTVHVALVISSVLLSQRGFLALVVLTTLATFTAPLYSNIPELATENIGRTGGIVLVIGIILYGINIFRANLDKEQRKELSETNRELEDLTANLEERIEARTHELQEASQQIEKRVVRLQAISDISQEISSNADLNIKELLTRITQTISEKIGFYHVGIFLLDENQEYAILRASNSKGGQQMLTRRHQLKVGGTGIVGYVAQSGRPRIALDTGADAVFFNNPDLPETRSEMALPLKFGDSIIGVLDVQSTSQSAFTDEDINTLSTLANQIATVIRNVQIAEGSGLDISRKGSRSAAQFSRKEQQSGYSFRPDGSIISTTLPQESPVLEKAIASSETVILTQPPKGTFPALAVPVKFRDQVIGIIHIEASETNRIWTDDEVAMVQAVSERAALALENARLFEDATRRAEQEETIARVTTQIGASTDFNRILQTTIQELGRALGASRSFIQLGTAFENGNEEAHES